jgi:4-hydroxy-3-polyprenylbenzoate decarboxylase
MPFSGLQDFIGKLEKDEALYRIKEFVDPILEITEITDRVVKKGGKALLFENNGTSFPILMNAFGSDSRMAAALGIKNLNEVTSEIMTLFGQLSRPKNNLFEKIQSLPNLVKISGYLPSHKRGKGKCQKIIHRNPDLSILPVLKCWPYDGGRFITLPMVHTKHPVTGSTNVGMYRMQILDGRTTAMHWQRHKTGAIHFEAWKQKGEKMPVSVTLGGDPVYTWASTAPLPENIDEYILAGFLRKKKVNLVKCITNDLWVPYDSDIVIEGYVDPAETLVWEGPFGDHTGFYSLADWYPRFHVTCITHSEKAIYPATIVGIPPNEDAWLTKATEKIFLAPMKMALQPEIVDFHMPDAGVAHNLVIVKIDKSYPGQGKKVISSLFGAGQMMFTKYMIMVSGDIDIRDYNVIARHVFENTDFRTDLLFSTGPLDVLDHTSDINSLGGKLGIDATVKLSEELSESKNSTNTNFPDTLAEPNDIIRELISDYGKVNQLNDLPVIIAGLDQSIDHDIVKKVQIRFRDPDIRGIARLILAVDHKVDTGDMFMVAWQVLGNSDPLRDIDKTSDDTLFIDGTIKAFRGKKFPRKWPNIVCSSEEMVSRVDKKWQLLGLGELLPSPSARYSKLVCSGTDEVMLDS